MIDIKLEDFEKYRPELLRYATGLLLSRGSANTKTSEITHKAKDIVQETYIVFHKHSSDNFVSENHLKNFVKMCLYRCYQSSIKQSLTLNKYSSLKTGDLDILIDSDHPLLEPVFDESDVFKSILDEDESNVLNLMLEGFKQTEIALKVKMNENTVHFIVKSIKDKYLGKKISKANCEKSRVEKIVLNSQKMVNQIDHNGVVLKTWSSGAIAAYELDLSASAISYCCNGKRLTHGNFKWSFA